MSRTQQPGHGKHKTWIRSDSSSVTAPTTSSRRAWSRTEASQDLSVQLDDPQALEHRHTRPHALSHDAEPSLHVPHAVQRGSQLREAYFGQCGAHAASALPNGEAQQYIKRRPNQLNLHAPPSGSTSGQGRKASVPASAVQRRPPPTAAHSGATHQLLPAAAALQRVRGAAQHPRQALQHQMLQRAAALSGRTQPPAPQQAATRAKARHVPAAAQTARTAKASKRWVRPDGAASTATGLPPAGLSTPAASTAASAQPSPAHPGLPAAVRTPRSAYRPSMPAWVRRSSSRSFASRLATSPVPRAVPATRKHTNRQVKRSAKVWMREAALTTDNSQSVTAATSQVALLRRQKGSRSSHRVWLASGADTATPPTSLLRKIRSWSRLPASPLSSRISRHAAVAAKSPSLLAERGHLGRHTKLQRIGGHLYRVSGSGSGKSLQRQPANPQQMHKPAAQQATSSAKKALRYSLCGKFKRVLIRRLSAAGTPVSSQRTSRTSVAATPASSQRKRRLRAVGSSRQAVGRIHKRQKLAGGKAARSKGAGRQRLTPQIYCSDFCRTGECSKRQTCKYVHDASKVAVCTKWLLGCCNDEACKLQHQLRPELMPVCSFFLKGTCSKADCPYLHVNLESDAKVCEAFLRGWCPAGAACRSKHLTADMVRQRRRERKLTPSSNAAKQESQQCMPRKRQRYFQMELDVEGDDDDDQRASASQPAAAQPALQEVERHYGGVAVSEDSSSEWEEADDEFAANMNQVSDFALPDFLQL